MKFTILKTSLLNALNTVSKAISNKNPNAISTAIKLELNELGLTLTFDDMLGKSLVDEGIPMRFADDDAVYQFLSKKNAIKHHFLHK